MNRIKRMYVSNNFFKKIKRDAIENDLSVTKYTEKLVEHLDEIKKKCVKGGKK